MPQIIVCERSLAGLGGAGMHGRLSDVIVFDDQAAKGRSALYRAFQQIVADEQRPTLVAKGAFKMGGVAAVAWDGGKEASRAMRTALPLLRKASSVVILIAPAATQRKVEPISSRPSSPHAE